jgi:hypothetical protein
MNSPDAGIIEPIPCRDTLLVADEKGSLTGWSKVLSDFPPQASRRSSLNSIEYFRTTFYKGEQATERVVRYSIQHAAIRRCAQTMIFASCCRKGYLREGVN